MARFPSPLHCRFLFALSGLLWGVSACGDKPSDTGGDGSADPDVVDKDGDGVGEADDCDDNNAVVYPGAEELCDGLDNNCDDQVDEGLSQLFYYDNDKDGYGSADTTVEDCAPPEGFVADGTDCQDLNGEIYPGAPEACDQIDSDCDGDLDDDDASGAVTVYRDADADGRGDPDQELRVCVVGVGYVTNAEDCDDTDPRVYLGAAYAESSTACMRDNDRDGYGEIVVSAPAQPGTDCDDNEALISPGVIDTCDGLDNDCSKATDEEGSVAWFDGTTWTDMTATFAAGTPSSPAVIAPTTSGTLQLCGGSWYAALNLTASTTVLALSPTTLDGAARRSVVNINGSGLDIHIEGMTLQNGAGLTNTTFSRTVGGGLQCNGANTLTLLDSVITGNDAEVGGGLFLDTCTVALDNVEISENTGSYGGGLFLYAGDVVISSSQVTGNDSLVTGGGLDVEAPFGATLELIDTAVSDNTAYYGGGMAVIYAADVVCTGSSKVSAGMLRNTATVGGAVALYFSTYTGSLQSDLCDFGTSAGKDDNSLSDVESIDSGLIYTYGDDASFLCATGSGCY